MHLPSTACPARSHSSPAALRSPPLPAGNAVSLPVSTWLGQRLAAPYAYKYHGGLFWVGERGGKRARASIARRTSSSLPWRHELTAAWLPGSIALGDELMPAWLSYPSAGARHLYHSCLLWWDTLPSRWKVICDLADAGAVKAGHWGGTQHTHTQITSVPSHFMQAWGWPTSAWTIWLRRAGRSRRQSSGRGFVGGITLGMHAHCLHPE